MSLDEITSIGYCVDCERLRPQEPEEEGLTFLFATFPFEKGDVVECRTGAKLYDGVGVIQEISVDLKDSGTLVHPAMRVKFTEKAYPEVPDELWYNEVCLKKVSNVSA